MVSGLKTNKSPNKGKQKLVVAKDPKQAAIAIAVIVLFALNSIYMIVKYVQEQAPAPAPTASQSVNSPKTPEEMQMEMEKMKMGQSPNGSPTSATGEKSPSAQPAGSEAANQPAPPQPVSQGSPTVSSGVNPVIPIAVILLLIALAYFGYKYMNKNGSAGNAFNKTGKQIKGKGKFVVASDPKQAAIAIAVIVLFVLNSIYMVVKYVQEQSPPPAPTASQSVNSLKTPEEMQMQMEKMKMGQNPDGSPTSATGEKSPSAQPAGSEAVNQPMQAQPVVSSGVNPVIPIAVVLLLLALAYFGYQYMNKNGSTSNAFKKSGKQVKGKGKFVVASDPKQAAIAIGVILLFLGNSIYMIVKYVQEQNPQPTTAQNPQNMTPEQQLAQQQKQNLESLAGGNSVAPDANVAQDASDIYSQTVNMQGGGSAVNNQATKMAQGSESDVEILPRRVLRDKNGKMVMIAVDNSGRSNPFLPAAENYIPSTTSSIAYLPPPPETLQTDSDAGKVMTTTISGILYDKYSPSAIINIEGVDYLVKRGDVVNRYKILSVGKTQVLVQLGKNVYRAGVGELLSLTDMNFNTIANLNRKFGGNDVSVNVRKKGY